jgi:hypothetical protein
MITVEYFASTAFLMRLLGFLPVAALVSADFDIKRIYHFTIMTLPLVSRIAVIGVI